MIRLILWVAVIILLIAVMIYYNEHYWTHLCTINPHHAGCGGR